MSHYIVVLSLIVGLASPMLGQSQPTVSTPALSPPPAQVATLPAANRSPLLTGPGAPNAMTEPIGVAASSADLGRSVVEYQKILAEQSKQYQDFLRNETDRHQSFIEHWFSTVKWVVSVALGLFIALFTWFGWQTRRDLRTEIGELFRTRVAGLIDKKLRDFEDHVEKGKTRVE